MSSIAEMLDQYGSAVYRRCRQMLGDDDKARDAVHEVFLRVVKKPAQFRGDCSPLTWLYRVATTYCLQQLRNRKRQHEKLRRITNRAAGESGLNPDHRLVVLELTENFDPATMTLAYLRYIDELTMDEMAEVTGLSRKTVSKKLARFERKARSRLADTTAEARS